MKPWILRIALQNQEKSLLIWTSRKVKLISSFKCKETQWTQRWLACRLLKSRRKKQRNLPWSLLLKVVKVKITAQIVCRKLPKTLLLVKRFKDRPQERLLRLSQSDKLQRLLQDLQKTMMMKIMKVMIIALIVWRRSLQISRSVKKSKDKLQK